MGSVSWNSSTKMREKRLPGIAALLHGPQKVSRLDQQVGVIEPGFGGATACRKLRSGAGESDAAAMDVFPPFPHDILDHILANRGQTSSRSLSPLFLSGSG